MTFDQKFFDDIDKFLEENSPIAFRRRFMKACSKASFDAVYILQTAFFNKLEFDEELSNTLDNIELTKEIYALIELLWLEIDMHPSPALHQLIVDVESRLGIQFISDFLVDNPHLSETSIAKFTSDITLNPYAHLYDEQARSLASRKQASAKSLDALFRVNDLSTRKYVAKNPNTSAKTLRRFLVHKSKPVQRLLSEAVNVEDSSLIYLLKQEDDSAANTISRRNDISDLIVAHLLLNPGPAPLKKRLKSFFQDNPEWFNVRQAVEKSGMKPLKRQTIPSICEEDLIEDHTARVNKIYDHVLAYIEHSQAQDQASVDKAIHNYREDESCWKELLINESCPDYMLQELFLKGIDVTINPKVQQRLKHDLSYMRRLIPSTKQAKLELAQSTRLPSVLSAMIFKEKYSKKMDLDVLKILKTNPAINNDLKELIEEAVNPDLADCK